MKILHLDSSVLGRELGSRAAPHPQGRRGVGAPPPRPPPSCATATLGSEAPQHLSPGYFTIGATPEDKRSESQSAELKLSDSLIEELLAADGPDHRCAALQLHHPLGLEGVDRPRRRRG